MVRSIWAIGILVYILVHWISCGESFKKKGSEKDRTVLYKNVNVVDVKNRKIHYGQNIVTRGGKIFELMKYQKGTDFAADTTVYCHGSYVISSIADLHHHLTPSDFDFQNWSTQRQLDIARDQVKFGIQAVLNPNNSFESSLGFKELKNDREFPFLFYSGPSIGPEGGWGNYSVKNETDILQVIDSIHSVGASFVKFTYDDMSWLGANMPVLDTVLIKKLITYGHQKNLRVLAHVVSKEKVNFLVRNGIDGLIHGIVSDRVDAETLDLMNKNNVVYMPTTAVYETSFNFQGAVKEQFEYDIWGHYPEIFKDSLSNDASNNTWNSWWPEANRLGHQLPNVHFNTKEVYRNGIKVILGSDTGTPGVLPGISTYYEMALMERSGLSPFEVLECAILNPLEFLGIANQTGSIEPDKLANMIFLSKNPAESIKNMKTVWMVVHNGEIVSHRQAP